MSSFIRVLGSARERRGMFCSRVCVWLLGPLFGAKAENTRRSNSSHTSTFVLTRIRPSARFKNVGGWRVSRGGSGAAETIKRLLPGRPRLRAVISPTSCELYRRRRPKRWTPNLLFSGETRCQTDTRELNTAVCNHVRGAKEEEFGKTSSPVVIRRMFKGGKKLEWNRNFFKWGLGASCRSRME